MPRTKSAKKQMRQAKSRTLRNKAQRSALKTAVKKVRSATSPADISAAYAEAKSILDRSGRKGIIHPNTAARQKSRLARLVK